jgi:hypothetical protein
MLGRLVSHANPLGKPESKVMYAYPSSVYEMSSHQSGRLYLCSPL